MNESQRDRILNKSVKNGVEQQLEGRRILMPLLITEMYVVHRMKIHCLLELWKKPHGQEEPSFSQGPEKRLNIGVVLQRAEWSAWKVGSNRVLSQVQESAAHTWMKWSRINFLEKDGLRIFILRCTNANRNADSINSFSFFRKIFVALPQFLILDLYLPTLRERKYGRVSTE